MIAMVIVDQDPQIAMRITSADLHVQSFTAWVACNLTTNQMVGCNIDSGKAILQLAGGSPALT